MTAILKWVHGLFTTWRFAAFAIFVLLAATGLMLLILAVPAAPSGIGALAEEFKVWCFGYDPATGRLPWSSIGSLMVEAAVLITVVLGVWRREFENAVRQPRQLAVSAIAALVVVVIAAVALGASRPGVRDGELPFPATRIRTAFPAPEFALVDQNGAGLSMAELRGRVVLVTGVYAQCGSTCPRLIREARHATLALTAAERALVTVVGVTLDPAHDSPDVLGRLAATHLVSAPLFRFVTGAPPDVERALDALSIARERDPETGVISHANVFVLIDRRGRIAYRLSLGPQRERWLVDALRTLASE